MLSSTFLKRTVDTLGETMLVNRLETEIKANQYSDEMPPPEPALTSKDLQFRLLSEPNIRHVAKTSQLPALSELLSHKLQK